LPLYRQAQQALSRTVRGRVLVICGYLHTGFLAQTVE
jgi:hypothetical protein